MPVKTSLQESSTYKECPVKQESTHHNEVADPVLVGAEEAEYDGHQLQEVGDDGQPHVAEEVECLALDGRQLRTKGSSESLS